MHTHCCRTEPRHELTGNMSSSSSSRRSVYAVILCAIAMMMPDGGGSAVIKRCACWEGYKPEVVGGTLQCHGVQVAHTMSCDVLPPPRCACTGHNGILKDRSGTWCTIYLQGAEVKRWRCENRREWDAFFERLQAQQQLYEQKRPKPRP